MSTPSSFSRVPAGVPTGGQFAATAKAEASTVLADPATHPLVLAATEQARATGKPIRLPDIDGITSHGAQVDASGTSCGDYSVGAEASNRMTWATGDPDEPFITATTTYYITARTEGGSEDLDYDDMAEQQAAIAAWENAGREGDEPELLRFGVDEQTEWIAHTDPSDPGGTEVRADYVPGPGYAYAVRELDRAEEIAANLANNEDWDHYAPEHWN